MHGFNIAAHTSLLTRQKNRRGSRDGTSLETLRTVRRSLPSLSGGCTARTIQSTCCVGSFMLDMMHYFPCSGTMRLRPHAGMIQALWPALAARARKLRSEATASDSRVRQTGRMAAADATTTAARTFQPAIGWRSRSCFHSLASGSAARPPRVKTKRPPRAARPRRTFSSRYWDGWGASGAWEHVCARVCREWESVVRASRQRSSGA